MATFAELLAQAQASQPVNTWGVSNQETGQWSPYDTTNGEFTGPALDPWTGAPAAGVSQQMVGQTGEQAVNDLILGPNQDFTKSILAQVSQAAGLPADFDWTPYLIKGLENHYNASGGQTYNFKTSNYAGPAKLAVEAAAAQYPQLTSILPQLGDGSAIWGQGDAMRAQAYDANRSARRGQYLKAGSVLAAPLAAAYLAPAAGAGAAGTESAGGALGSGLSLGAAEGAASVGGLGSGLTATAAEGGLGAGLAAGGGSSLGAGALGTGLTAALGSAGSGATGLTGTVGGVGAGGGSVASGSALSRILSGGGGLQDYLSIGGQILPSLISAYGSHLQAQDQRELADRYFGMGQPYRDKLAALYANPDAFLASKEVQTPVQMGTDATARALSTQGNPAGSGRALQEIQNYSANQLFSRLGEEKNRLGGLGGLATFNAAAPGAAQQAISAQGQVYGDLGYGLGNVMNPQQQSLASILKQYNISQGLA